MAQGLMGPGGQSLMDDGKALAGSGLHLAHSGQAALQQAQQVGAALKGEPAAMARLASNVVPGAAPALEAAKALKTLPSLAAPRVPVDSAKALLTREVLA